MNLNWTLEFWILHHIIGLGTLWVKHCTFNVECESHETMKHKQAAMAWVFQQMHFYLVFRVLLKG